VPLPSPRALVGILGGVAATAVVFPPLALGVLAVAAMRPLLQKRRAAQQRTNSIERDVADLVTLLGLAVNSGHNLTGALRVASARGAGPVTSAIRAQMVTVSRGVRLADALEALPDTLGEPVRPFVAALVSCDRYGASVGRTLDRLALDVRTASRQRHEAAARRLPIRLLFPLVTCILPAFGLLTVAPLIAGSFRELRL
jgi:tight adherence protein C